MKKSANLILSALLLVILTGCAQTVPGNNAATENTKDQAVAKTATLLINYGDRTDQFEITIEPGNTVLQVMEKLTGEGKLNFASNDSAMGAFIDAINGVANDSAKNMYWMLYINDKIAEMGVSNQTVTAGDKVEWKYIDASSYSQ